MMILVMILVIFNNWFYDMMPASNNPGKFPAPQKQGGVIIIVVVLIVTLMVTLLAFMIEKQHLLIRRVGNQNVAEQGFQYAEAVNAWAERVLNDDIQRQVDYLGEDWAEFGRPEAEVDASENDSFSLDLSSQESEDDSERVVIDIGFDGLEYSIDDLQAKFNLNNLSSTNKTFLASQKRIFLNLLELIEVGDSDQRERLYGALTDWVDANDLESVNGVESGTYGTKKTSYYAADQQLSSVGELKFVEGFNSTIINQLRPYVTVLPIDNARININTASAELLASLNSATVVDVGSVTAFLARRLQNGFQGFTESDIQAAETAIIGVNPVGAQPVPNMIQVNSQFFQINAKVILGDYLYCMKTIVLREPLSQGGTTTPKVSILSREQNTLCKEEENTTIISSDENLS